MPITDAQLEELCRETILAMKPCLAVDFFDETDEHLKAARDCLYHQPKPNNPS